MPPLFRLFTVALGLLLLPGCASVERISLAVHAPELRKAERNLLRARVAGVNPDTSAGLYLNAAELSAGYIERDPAAIATPRESTEEKAAREIYNEATAELTALLSRPAFSKADKSGDDPALNTMWAVPRTLLSPDGGKYALSFSTDPYFLRGTTWNPDYFNSLTLASKAKRKVFKTWVVESGIGGTLVGAHGVQGDTTQPRELFLPRPCFLPATSVVNFKPGKNGIHEAKMTLYSPSRATTASFQGKNYPLSGDFSAPLATIPRRNDILEGVYNLLRVDLFKPRLGTYFYAPYDPDKIPVVLIHGLASTSQIWFNVVNELSRDPEIRQHYQFWVFYYPTGNPISYSAYRLRDDIAKIDAVYKPRHGMILIGHSMGGLLSKMQVQNSGRHVWNLTFKSAANQLWPAFPADSLVKKALVFRANPEIKRVIFINTPHRGSGLAAGVGAWAARLIALPSLFITEIPMKVVSVMLTATGQNKFRVPTSIEGLSPKSPLLAALNDLKIEAPHDSIIGDRGKGGDKWLGSDGVVQYWSSHLEDAESELIVPTDHGAFKSPVAVEDIRRILLENLGRKAKTNANESRN